MAGSKQHRGRIVVAMSGGVDSSTAAALLVEQGYEVIGVAMKTHSLAPKSNRACCTPDDMRDARRVADALAIPFYVLAYEELFAREVVRPFVAAYRAGLTPNPCIACNDRVKFAPLLERARLLGADKLATGHYARLRAQPGQAPRLLRAVDANKDQSYFLYRLRPEQLRMLQFPLGELTKEEVRGHARRLGLAVADKGESQDICFVGPAGYAAVVDRACGASEAAATSPESKDESERAVRLPVAGAIVDAQGRVLGHHAGVHHFTVGQRRGIGPCLFRASREPLFVTHIDAASAEVTVGAQACLVAQEVTIVDLSWTHAAPTVGQKVSLRQRHREPLKSATVVQASQGKLTLHLLAASLRGAPGQAAVLYDGDELLGGGTLAARPRDVALLGQAERSAPADATLPPAPSATEAAAAAQC